jgi:hypothetical protein
MKAKYDSNEPLPGNQDTLNAAMVDEKCADTSKQQELRDDVQRALKAWQQSTRPVVRRGHPRVHSRENQDGI